jgi:transposase
MTTSGAWIGVDICKKHLDVGGITGTPVRVTNDADGRAALARRLKAENVQGVILEATGGLERALMKAFDAEGVPACIVNPARVRKFAEGIGQLAKTDKIDTPVLARYGDYMKPAPTVLADAPFANESGDRKGYRSIRGGRDDVRQALFNCARVAIQHNPVANAFYQRLRARGKPHKVAIVATMRKLLTILNAMLKTGNDWTCKPR